MTSSCCGQRGEEAARPMKSRKDSRRFNMQAPRRMILPGVRRYVPPGIDETPRDRADDEKASRYKQRKGPAPGRSGDERQDDRARESAHLSRRVHARADDTRMSTGDIQARSPGSAKAECRPASRNG